MRRRSWPGRLLSAATRSAWTVAQLLPDANRADARHRKLPACSSEAYMYHIEIMRHVPLARSGEHNCSWGDGLQYPIG